MGYIYLTTNLANGKKYIGQSKFTSEKTKTYLGSGDLLKQSIKKYGKKQFTKKIIVEGDFSENLLNDLEKHYIQLHGAVTNPKYYNIDSGGNHPPIRKNPTKYHKIYQYDSTGKVLNVFDSVASAASYCGIDAERIYPSIYNNQEVLKLASFFTTDSNNIKPRKTTKTKVDLYDNNGDFVKTFSSIKTCAKSIGVVPGSISNGLMRKAKANCNGYHIVYHNDSQPVEKIMFYFYTKNGELVDTFFGTREGLLSKYPVTRKQLYESNRYNHIIGDLNIYITEDVTQVISRINLHKHKTYYKISMDNQIQDVITNTTKEAAKKFGVSVMTFFKYKDSDELKRPENFYIYSQLPTHVLNRNKAC